MKLTENLSIALTAVMVAVKTARDLKNSVRNGALGAVTPTPTPTLPPSAPEAFDHDGMTTYWLERPSRSLEELLHGVKMIADITLPRRMYVMGPLFDTRTALRAQYGSALEADSGGGRRVKMGGKNT